MHGDTDYTPDAPKKTVVPSTAASRTSVKKRKRNKCWCFLWFFMIILIAWPLSLFVSLFYVILMPFGVCVPAIHELCDILLKLMQVSVVICSCR